MAQLGTQRLGETDQCTAKTTQHIPTFEQFIHDEEAVWQPNRSPVGKNQEQDDDQMGYSKKSVFTKVKEKLSNSFSGKHRWGPESQENNTPPWGVTLKDLDDEDEDNPENLGAPTYESELAPTIYKNTTSERYQITRRGGDGYSDVDNSRTVKSRFHDGKTVINYEGNSKTREDHTSMSAQIHDKRISLEDYLNQNLEPGEEQPSQSSSNSPTDLIRTNSSLHNNATKTASPYVPISTNTVDEVVPNENRERVLKKN